MNYAITIPLDSSHITMAGERERESERAVRCSKFPFDKIVILKSINPTLNVNGAYMSNVKCMNRIQLYTRKKNQ